jgi:hypothetical protein
VIATRRLQRSFADGFIFDTVEDLWEPWMRHADKALEDEALLLLIQQELMKRCKKSKTRGRPATPAEVVLRMMLPNRQHSARRRCTSPDTRHEEDQRSGRRGGNQVP